MADVIRYSFFLPNPKGAGAWLIEIFQREVGKTFRYMKIPIAAITEEQAKGICKIINDGGNIKNPCNYVVNALTYDFEWKVIESLKRAEADVYDKLQPYVKNTNAATSAAATQAPAAAPQQQGPMIFRLPITGTIIKEFKDAPSKFYFDLPFYDQNSYDEFYFDLTLGTNLIHWGSNINADNTIANFSFKIPEKAPDYQTKEDLETIDKLIEEYLKKYLAQKNAPAAAQAQAQPAATQSLVANLDGIKLDEPYYLLPVTGIQIYRQNIFNIPRFYFFLTGQKYLSTIAIDAVDYLKKNGDVTTNTAELFDVKSDPDLIQIQFELTTDNISRQEQFFLQLDFIIYNSGYIKLANPLVQTQTSAPKPDAVIDIETQVDKLKTELDQLVFLRSLNSDLDFEKNIELGQKIANVKENINELNFSKLEAKLTTDDIFDQLFEQSFTPIQHEYNDVKVTQGQEGDFFTPNGQPSQLSEQLNEIIRTQQFKDWFGDWQLTYMYKQAGDTDTDCSVVLTENFEPKLFYHGTGQAFSYFKFDKFPAAYFAANPDYSKFFANLHGGDEGYVIPFFLNVRNPLDLTLFGTELIKPKEFFDYVYLKTGYDADQLEANPIFNNPTSPPVECWRYLRNNPKMLKKLADNEVYDGIHFYETNPGVPVGQSAHKTEVFITFKPEQCKIADNNRGLILLGALKSFLLEKGGKI